MRREAGGIDVLLLENDKANFGVWRKGVTGEWGEVNCPEHVEKNGEGLGGAKAWKTKGDRGKEGFVRSELKVAEDLSGTTTGANLRNKGKRSPVMRMNLGGVANGWKVGGEKCPGS